MTVGFPQTSFQAIMDVVDSELISWLGRSMLKHDEGSCVEGSPKLVLP